MKKQHHQLLNLLIHFFPWVLFRLRPGDRGSCWLCGEAGWTIKKHWVLSKITTTHFRLFCTLFWCDKCCIFVDFSLSDFRWNVKLKCWKRLEFAFLRPEPLFLFVALESPQAAVHPLSDSGGSGSEETISTQIAALPKTKTSLPRQDIEDWDPVAGQKLMPAGAAACFVAIPEWWGTCRVSYGKLRRPVLGLTPVLSAVQHWISKLRESLDLSHAR